MPDTQKAEQMTLLSADAKATEESAKATADAGKATETEAEKTAAEDAAATAAKAAGTVPEKYDLKLPDGALLDPARVEGIAAYAKAQGLSQDAAQALLQREAEAVEVYSKAQEAHIEKERATWVEAVKADAEIGGEHLNENVEMAKRALTKFGSDSLIKTLNATGLGNHPELVRVFSRIGKAMSEDKLVLPGAQTNGTKSDAELFYGSSPNKE